MQTPPPPNLIKPLGLAGNLPQALPSVPENLHQAATVLAAVFIAGIVLLLVRRLLGLLLLIRSEQAFLELTPPRLSNTSPISTGQLFGVVSGMLSHRTPLERMLGAYPTYSFEIVSRKESGIRYVMRLPKKAAPLLEKSLRSYLPGLKIEETTDYLELAKGAKVTPFRFTKHFALPLNVQSDLKQHDPLAYLTGNMSQLENDETLALQVVLSKVPGNRRRAASRTLSLINRNLDGELERTILQHKAAVFLSGLLALVLSPLNLLTETLLGYRLSASPDRVNGHLPQGINEAVRGKLEQPLMEASVSILVAADNESRKQRRLGLASSFAGYLHSSGQTIASRRTFQRLTLWNYRHRLSGNLVLTPLEAGALYHFPLSETEDLVRSRSASLPAPLPMKKPDAMLDITLGTNRFGGLETKVGLNIEERRRHTYVIGSTGSGKTTLLSGMVYQDLLKGKGLCVVDPHGQLVERMLSVIPEERMEDVVWFSPDDTEFPVSINLLELPESGLTEPQMQKRKSLIASSLNSIFQKYYDARYFGPRMEYLLRNAVLTALETPSPTLLTIQDLLTKPKYRKSVVAGLTNPTLKDFWAYCVRERSTTLLAVSGLPGTVKLSVFAMKAGWGSPAETFT